MVHTDKIRSLPKKNSDLTTLLIKNKCLQQIKIPDLHHLFAPCFELSSYISNMSISKEKLIISSESNLCPRMYYKNLGKTSWTYSSSILEYALVTKDNLTIEELPAPKN